MIAQSPFERTVISLEHEVVAALQTALNIQPCFSPLCERTKRLHIIGVRVSETKGRDQNRRANGHRELVQQASDNAAHEHHRDKHSDQARASSR